MLQLIAILPMLLLHRKSFKTTTVVDNDDSKISEKEKSKVLSSSVKNDFDRTSDLFISAIFKS